MVTAMGSRQATVPGLRTLLWKHQRAAFAFALDRPATLLAMAMGTGKSLTTLALLEAWDAQRVLIVCPKSVIAAWPEQFRRHVETPWSVCPLTKGTVAEKAALADTALKTSPRVCLIVNYESAREPALAKLLSRTAWDVVVGDELHRIKDARSLTSKTMRAIGKRATRRLGLTGTPMPHSPLDVFGQFRFLDDRIFGISWLSFRNTYAITNPVIPQMVVRYKHLDDLQERFSTIAFRVENDVLDLPSATHVTRSCDLSPSARRLYRDLERDFTTTLEAHAADPKTVTASNVLVKLLRLQTVTGGHLKDDDGDEHTVDTSKADQLTDLFTDLGRAEPVVVFCRFRRDLDTVRRVVGDDRYRELSGRRNDLDAWQDGDGSVLGVQIASGGVGIDLTRARVCVYWSKDFSLGAYDQSLARVHRPGQTRPVLYVHLIAAGTIDEKIEQALHSRRDLVESLLEGLGR